MTTTTNATAKPIFASRIISKPELQTLLTAIRKDKNVTVTRLDGGYEATLNASGELILRAMDGERAYLCRLNKQFFAC